MFASPLATFLGSGRRSPGWVRIISMACLLLAGCDSCEDRNPLAPLVSVLTPSVDRVSFEPTYVGRDRIRPLDLRSSGSGPVELAATLQGSAAFSLVAEAPVRLAAGESVRLFVRFAPEQAGAAEGRLIIDSDADTGARIEIALTAQGRAVPPCDDESPCTDDVFDFDAEACVHTNHQRACVSDNACIADSFCFDGQCRGVAVTCDASVSCMEAFCDPAVGCVERQRPGTCVDDDPCTDNVCGGNGCENPVSSNGSICGPVVPCSEIPLCFAGDCVAIVPPDGSPCFDGDMCTVNDVCSEGVCGGTRLPEDPSVLAQIFHLPSEGVPLKDGRWVLARSFEFSDEGRLRIAVLAPSPDGLSLRSDVTLDLGESVQFPRGSQVFPVATSSFAVRTTTGFMFFSVANDDTVSRRGFLLASLRGSSLSESGGFAYFCAETPDVSIVDVTNLDAPVVVGSVPNGDLTCSDAVVHPETNSLLTVSTRSDLLVLRRFDLTLPAVPAFTNEATLPASPSFTRGRFSTGGGRVVVYVPRGQDLVFWEEAHVVDPLTAAFGASLGTYGNVVMSETDFLGHALTAGAPAQGPLSARPWSDIEDGTTVGFTAVERASCHPTAFDGRILLCEALFAYSSSPPTLTPVWPASFGTSAHLIHAGDQVLSMAAPWAHVVSVADPDAPFVERNLFIDYPTLLVVAATLVSFESAPSISRALLRPSPSLPNPLRNVTSFHGSSVLGGLNSVQRLTVAGDGTVRTADPIALLLPPLPAGATLGDQATGLEVDDRLYLAAHVVHGNSETAALLIYQLPPPSDVLLTSLTPSASLLLPDVPSSVINGDPFLGYAQGRLALLTSAPQQLLLFDVSTAQPALLSRVTPPTGMDRPTILVAEEGVLMSDVSRVLFFPVVNGVLLSPAELALTAVQGLFFDGASAVVSTMSGIAFLRVSANEITVEHEIDLGEPAWFGEFVSDRLYVTTAGGIHVVYPPCPAP